MDTSLIKLDNWLTEWQITQNDYIAFGIIVVMMAVLLHFRHKLVAYKTQLAQAEQAHQHTEQVLAGLLNAQQQDSDQLAQLKQQLATLNDTLRESEKAQAALTEETEQQRILLAERQAKVESMQDELQRQNELADHLMDELEHGNQQTEMPSELQAKLDELERELLQQQAELKRKTDRLEQLDKNRQDAVSSESSRVVELERQLAKMHTEKADLIPRQQFSRLEQEKQALEQSAQHAAKLESYFQRHNEQLSKLNEQLQTALIQTETTASDEASTLADKALALLGRLLSILTVSGPIEHVDAEADVGSNEKAEALWLQHYDYIDRLLGRAAMLVEASETAQTGGGMMESLRQTINEQQNHIDRLEYDLEIKKMIIKNKGLSEQSIPGAILQKQRLDQARIEELEKRLAGGIKLVNINRTGKQGFATEIMDLVAYKFKRLFM